MTTKSTPSEDRDAKSAIADVQKTTDHVEALTQNDGKLTFRREETDPVGGVSNISEPSQSITSSGHEEASTDQVRSRLATPPSGDYLESLKLGKVLD